MRTDLYQRIEAVRRFNRFYTRKIGVLQEGLLRSPFSLTEARVIYELAHYDCTTATELGRELGLDGGYLSRILNGLRKQGLIQKEPSETDGRQQLLSLTDAGLEAFAALNSDARMQIEAMLGMLSEEEQGRLVGALQTVEHLLDARPERRSPYILRSHQPGDMGWVIYRHGVLYNQEYGWDERFEALVADVTARFIQNFDPERERCWIAEMKGEIVGSIFLMKKSKTIAQLRLLLVEPKARGLGLGRRLIQECTRFARRAGYRKITLWTNHVLHAARRLYIEEGYHLVQEEPHTMFGNDLIGQTWELELTSQTGRANRIQS